MLLTIVDKNINQIKPYKNNPKLHSKHQIKQIADSIKEFGFVNPVLLDENGEIIAGHGRYLAAKQLNMENIPTITLSHLNDEQKRLYRIADNKLTELGKWDVSLLQMEFKELENLNLDLEITGFETEEIDNFIINKSGPTNLKEEHIPELSTNDYQCKFGDIWQLGRHFLICGDALKAKTYANLIGNNRAQMILTDPPYNVRVKDIGSSGKIKHDEFAMASGEMSSDEFITFLNTFMKHAKEYSIDGSLHYLFMDWRHGIEIGLAASIVYEELKNICVWVKNNGGMGSLYRSQHELCFIYKNGKGPHTNNINLGAHGRYRTNVWEYAGANGSADGKENLKLHPTVKPVAMLKDAILDVTKRGNIVLDCFLWSGSTLIACEQTGRTCYGIEIEPKYCDVTIKRYEELTGEKAIKIGDADDRIC
ncbi:MAG: ParB N-terminal domain-containing protein [Alphaproteobacteria bacterium]|nr:ParB N-terminal domain-containing protein [Alphaproteobacteria bacterium]